MTVLIGKCSREIVAAATTGIRQQATMIQKCLE